MQSTKCMIKMAKRFVNICETILSSTVYKFLSLFPFPSPDLKQLPVVFSLARELSNDKISLEVAFSGRTKECFDFSSCNFWSCVLPCVHDEWEIIPTQNSSRLERSRKKFNSISTENPRHRTWWGWFFPIHRKKVFHLTKPANHNWSRGNETTRRIIQNSWF